MNDLIHSLHAHSALPGPAAARDEPRWGIEDIAARADVSARLVRHCEARGLLGNSGRGGASERRYTPGDVSILRFVRRAHVLGFGMDETAQLLRSWWGGPAPRHLLQRLGNAHPDEQQPSCPILEALMEAGRRQRPCPGPLP